MSKKNQKKKKTNKVDEPTSSNAAANKSKNGKPHKPLPDDDQGKIRPEKEVKRRSSLTDSPLTSSSSSSADDTELNNKEQRSTHASNSLSAEHSGNISLDGKKTEFLYSEINDAANNEASEKNIISEPSTASKKQKKRKNNSGAITFPHDGLEAEKWLNTSTKPASKNFSKPSYSTAGQTAVVTTVSSITSKMSCSIYSNSGDGTTKSSASTSITCVKDEIIEPESQRPSSSSTQKLSAVISDLMASIPKESLKQNFSEPANEMTKEEKFQLLEEMDSSLAQFGVGTGRRFLTEELNNTAKYTKSKKKFVSMQTNLRQEMEVSRSIVDFLEKTIGNRLKKHPYMYGLHRMLMNGDIEGVVCRLKYISMALVHKKLGGNLNQRCDLDLLMRRIISTLLKLYRLPEGTSIFMLLASSHSLNQRCTAKNHGYCRLIVTLLRLCSVQERVQEMATIFNSSGKNILHLVACIGEVCQMKAVLSAGLNPNLYDDSGRSAIHYAIDRRCIEMQRVLSWYGCDVSLCPKNLLNNGTLCYLLPGSFLNLRMQSLQATFTNYVKSLLADFAPEYIVLDSISAMHSARYYSTEHIGKKVSQVKTAFNLKICQTGRDIRYYVFMMPIYFHEQDQNPIYQNNPQIFPVKFPEHTVIDQTLTLIKGDDIYQPDYKKPILRRFPTLPPLRIRGYELPIDISKQAGPLLPYTLVFNINSEQSFPEFNRCYAAYPIIQIMAFAVQNISLEVPVVQRIDADLMKPRKPEKELKAKLD